MAIGYFGVPRASVNEVKCSALDREMIFYSHANKTHFHKKGCALGLILKVRVFGTRKWPILVIRSINSYLLARFILHHHTNTLRRAWDKTRREEQVILLNFSYVI